MKQRIVITLVDDSDIDVNAFCKKIESEGVEIDTILSFGVITGKSDSAIMEKLRGYNEVQDVSFDKSINLPPPSSEVQ